MMSLIASHEWLHLYLIHVWLIALYAASEESDRGVEIKK